MTDRPDEHPPELDVAAHEGLARAMGGLHQLGGRPLSEHVEAFELVHAALGGALARSDQA